MNPTIRSLPAFRIAGYRLETTMSRAMSDIPPFWGEINASYRIDALLAAVDPAAEPPDLIGASVCAADAADADEMQYWVGVTLAGPLPDGMGATDVPAATWAVFDAPGELPGAIQQLIPRIWGEWLPTSGYRATDAPLLEIYHEGDSQEVWLPVEPVEPVEPA